MKKSFICFNKKQTVNAVSRMAVLALPKENAARVKVEKTRERRPASKMMSLARKMSRKNLNPRRQKKARASSQVLVQVARKVGKNHPQKTDKAKARNNPARLTKARKAQNSPVRLRVAPRKMVRSPKRKQRAMKQRFRLFDAL